MTVDPFPGTAEPTLEARLRALFQAQIPTREPDKDGLWFKDGKLHLRVEGKTYSFTPS